VTLKKYFPDVADDGEPELDLFHARCLFGDRDKREKRALVRFGKEESKVDCGEDGMKIVRRPDCAVLVATQVIEQSLDLDFDLMITEMAPVDLVLQRAGRLQRHQRHRPARFQGGSPEIWIWAPKLDASGVPDFGSGTGAVYDPHILLRSWLVLKDRPSIKVPDDVEALIAKVYDEDEWSGELPEPIRKQWDETKTRMVKRFDEEKNEAQDRWIKPPGYSGDLWRMTYEPKEEDDPTLHTAHLALTRLTGINVDVLCLYGKNGQLYLDKEGQNKVDLNSQPDFNQVISLLRRSIKINHEGLAEEIIRESKLVPQEWRKSSLLRHHFILRFDENSVCQIGRYRVCLDDELGLMIEKSS
jgi:CRISPR-associated endonuclease/helicase Cas3